jgi:threonine synthase
MPSASNALRYVSTRGGAQPTSFADTLLEGLAPDGGLFIPESWPSFTESEIAAFAGRPYAEVASAVVGKFAGEAFPPEVLEPICAEAYATFSHPAVTPLRELDTGLWLLELFHGPTLAFKDVAMQLLARLYERVLGQSGRRLTIVVATSGDTGGAAVEAFRGVRGVSVVVLFPEGRISEVQRRFMTTTAAANIRCVAVDGSFDDCQTIVKGLFRDDAFRKAVDLSGVNSINWARVAAQAVYYFTSAVALGAPSRRVSFAVPTGNFGDAFAGYVASRLGLPIERITLCVNSNDILARALNEGVYAQGKVAATMSPAMDIQIASNFERLFFESVGRDPAVTASAFQAFSASTGIHLPPAALAGMRALFSGQTVSEAETSQAMAQALKETGELIDPHTAVGYAAARRIERGATPLIVLSTAHPAKFPEAVEAATGQAPALHPRAKDLYALPEAIDRLPAEIEAVKAYVRGFVGA